MIQVKRKEPLELEEGGELKRARPSTPPDEEDEGMPEICNNMHQQDVLFLTFT